MSEEDKIVMSKRLAMILFKWFTEGIVGAGEGDISVTVGKQA
jgi:hypothetical protein